MNNYLLNNPPNISINIKLIITLIINGYNNNVPLLINTIINKLCFESGITSVKYNDVTNYTDDDDDYDSNNY